MRRLVTGLSCLAAMLPAMSAPMASEQAAASVVSTGVRNFAPATYHADRQNWAIAEDNRGMLYFGNTSGVLEFDGTRWRLIALPDGRGAFALGKSSDGRILVGSQGEVGWLAPDASGTMVYVSKANDLPTDFRSSGEPVIQILDAPEGEVFLSDHWLFLRPRTGALTILRSGDHFLHAAWFNSVLYVLDSARGLLSLNHGSLENVAGGSGMRGLTMLPTASGLLIPSYDEGLVMYSPGSPTPSQTVHLNNWEVSDNAGVTSAIAINDHLLALGTAKHGVALIDTRGGTLQRLDVELGLVDPHVYNLAYDHNGNLWLATANGISLVGLNLPKGPAATPFHAWVRSVTGTQDEKLLFGGTFFSAPGGVQQLLQSSLQRLRFHFKYNAFRFDYSANGLQTSGDMQFQTYMRGADNDWSAWSTRTEREFTQLGAGKWVFRVRARKPDGEISREGVYELTMRPAWYATWWFVVIQVLFVLVILVLPGHVHYSKWLQDILTNFATIVPFVYLGDALEGFVQHYYSAEVALIKVIMSAMLSLMLDPIKEYLKMHVERRNHRRRERHLHRKAEHEAK